MSSERRRSRSASGEVGETSTSRSKEKPEEETKRFEMSSDSQTSQKTNITSNTQEQTFDNNFYTPLISPVFEPTEFDEPREFNFHQSSETGDTTKSADDLHQEVEDVSAKGKLVTTSGKEFYTEESLKSKLQEPQRETEDAEGFDEIDQETKKRKESKWSSGRTKHLMDSLDGETEENTEGGKRKEKTQNVSPPRIYVKNVKQLKRMGPQSSKLINITALQQPVSDSPFIRAHLDRKEEEKRSPSINEPQCSLNLSEKPELCTTSQRCTSEEKIQPERPASPLPRVNQGLVESFITKAEKDDQQMFAPISIKDYNIYDDSCDDDIDDESFLSSEYCSIPEGLYKSSLSIPDTAFGDPNTNREYLQALCEDNFYETEFERNPYSKDSGCGERQSNFDSGAANPDKSAEGRNICSTFFSYLSASCDCIFNKTRQDEREPRITEDIDEEMQLNFCQLFSDHRTDVVKLPKYSDLLDENYDEKQEVKEINKTGGSSAFRDEMKKKEKDEEQLPPTTALLRNTEIDFHQEMFTQIISEDDEDDEAEGFDKTHQETNKRKESKWSSGRMKHLMDSLDGETEEKTEGGKRKEKTRNVSPPRIYTKTVEELKMMRPQSSKLINITALQQPVSDSPFIRTHLDRKEEEKSPSSINEPQCSLNLSEKPELCTRSQRCTPEETIKPERPASPLPRVNQGFVEVFCTKAEKDDQQMFTPIISEDDEDEAYRFQSSGPGLYQCRVTGLVFHMQGQGEVFYRIIPWDRKLLSQHKKKPAGPLFDIKCQQKSMFQLHLPHCEILSSGGGKSLSTAHVNGDGVEFIQPHAVTETHVIINITGFSGFGNVQDEDSPPDPVRALVLLFYKLPHDDRSSRSSLNVLLVPRNIVIRDVQRTRRKLNGFEMFLDVCPHCKLKPKQVYTLSTFPEDALIKVQPREAEFDEENHSSYFTSFQVILKTFKEELNLNLTEKSSSTCVWEQEVCLPSSRAQTLNLPSSEKLLKIRSKFIQGVSEPVLQSLLDKLLENRVITDSEREKAEGKSIRAEKARFVLDTVRNKGEVACSKTVEFLCEVDPFFSGHLGLA